ncbi:hypothetical protein E1B28_009610 [Marasmius oreades]|uniref:Uncharacterized protein n=1 Tax=Marasmius oreades TaxID=181124 RepID=A0A9P7UQA1_9AGAR|nr:uncharacterized protein E1B28_009610 [Marasmius oreades]KAG7090497.1 hypothetical protein E1B28_009610 [Marasmius oreades]
MSVTVEAFTITTLPSPPPSPSLPSQTPLTCTGANSTVTDLKPSPKAVINGIAPHVFDERKTRPQGRGSGSSRRCHRRLQYIQKQYPRIESSPLHVSRSYTFEDLQVQAQVEFIVTDTKKAVNDSPMKNELKSAGVRLTRSRSWNLLKIHVDVHAFKSFGKLLKHRV